MTRFSLIALLMALATAGCAEFTLDGGMSPVSASVRQETGKDVVKISTPDEARRAREQVAALLAEPLTSDAAIQIALLNNRGLQAAFNELGISEAAYVQASLPPNPRFSISRLAGIGFVEFEFQLIGNLLALATLPKRTEIAARQFEEARYRAVEATLRLGVETRRAHIHAIAAQQRVRLLEQARFAADAAARMMVKLGETGAASKLDQARVAAFYAELSAQLSHARLRARAERETLAQKLGLWGTDLDFKLPPQLDALPRMPDTLTNVEVEAVRRRVDLVVARHEVVTMAKAFGLNESTRYISLLELAGIHKNETETSEAGEETTKRRWGLELTIEIPIFDTGEARTRSARETYMRSVNRLAEKAIIARSQARVAYDAYRATYDLSRFYQTRVVPLRQEISNEVLLRYNGMLIDVFEVLVDARERISVNVSALDALRDFHLATADLQAALIVGGAPSPGGERAPATPATSPSPGH
jgi:outer membrane protein TolC